MRPQKRKYRNKKERFFAGSGKFFVTILIVYLLFFGIKKIVGISREVKRYSRSELQITGNTLVTEKKVHEICGFYPGSDQDHKNSEAAKAA